MIGDVWVTLVLLESNGAVDAQTENWSTTRIGQVKNEVLEGTQWWEDTLLAQFPNSLQELNISVDFTHADTPVPTAYEPINHGIADQSLWIDSFLSHVGYNTASSVFTDLDTWNHAQRLAHNADWALTAFVVDSLADTDGKFSDGYFAYAYLGGPFMMMTYDNNGWGISRMGQVFAHEFAPHFLRFGRVPRQQHLHQHQRLLQHPEPERLRRPSESGLPSGQFDGRIQPASGRPTRITHRPRPVCRWSAGATRTTTACSTCSTCRSR